MLNISGELVHRARIALPPESVAIVQLRDISMPDDGRGVVAEERILLQGKQAPIPFTLKADRERLRDGASYAVRAAIFMGARPTWVSEPLTVDVKSGSVDLGTVMLNPFRAEAFTSNLLCGDLKIRIGFARDSMLLSVAGETIEMKQAGQGEGAKFVAVSDPATTFSTKGDRGTLVLRGKAYPECRMERAEDRIFRAIGNEPGWRLELIDGQLFLEWAYGAQKLKMPALPAGVTADFTRYAGKSEGRDVRVTIFNRLCADAMSGMPYPKTVAVEIGDVSLQGCGGEPASLLWGPEWVVEDIDKRGIIDNSRVTINFGRDGRVAGRASCNAYMGSYTLTGEGVNFSQMAGTLKACPEALMRQEGLFLQILKDVKRFEITPEGALILATDDNRTLKAFRTTQ